MDKRTKAATFFILATFTLVVSSTAQERVRDENGEFEYLAAANGVVITAPHGTYDVDKGFRGPHSRADNVRSNRRAFICPCE